MCQKSFENDLGIIIDNIQFLKHIFDVFFTLKMLFSEEKNLKIFGSHKILRCTEGGRGSAEISISHKKVQLHRGRVGLRPPDQKFDL